MAIKCFSCNRRIHFWLPTTRQSFSSILINVHAIIYYNNLLFPIIYLRPWQDSPQTPISYFLLYFLGFQYPWIRTIPDLFLICNCLFPFLLLDSFFQHFHFHCFFKLNCACTLCICNLTFIILKEKNVIIFLDHRT